MSNALFPSLAVQGLLEVFGKLRLIRRPHLAPGSNENLVLSLNWSSINLSRWDLSPSPGRFQSPGPTEPPRRRRCRRSTHQWPQRYVLRNAVHPPFQGWVGEVAFLVSVVLPHLPGIKYPSLVFSRKSPWPEKNSNNWPSEA
ncbi:MAG: hypothetical protein IPJ40_13365 [Saprospirales bacterium]|nr:hypothetical protein [Saprospirales bacterium]